VRDKFDTALMKWFGFYQAPESVQLARQDSSPSVPALVPAHFTPVQVQNALQAETPAPAAERRAYRTVSPPRLHRPNRSGSQRHTPLLQNPPRVR
jgi:hypothetical protein